MKSMGIAVLILIGKNSSEIDSLSVEPKFLVRYASDTESRLALFGRRRIVKVDYSNEDVKLDVCMGSLEDAALGLSGRLDVYGTEIFLHDAERSSVLLKRKLKVIL